MPPLRSAPKAEWVAYAIDHGVPSFVAWDETIEQLQARFEVPEPERPPEGTTDLQDVGPAHFEDSLTRYGGPTVSGTTTIAGDLSISGEFVDPNDTGPGHAASDPVELPKPARRPRASRKPKES